MKRLVMSTILFLLFTSLALGVPGSKTYYLVWSPNTEPDLAGYEVYWKPVGGEFSDQNKIVVGNVTRYKISGTIPLNQEIALTAYDLSGNVSGYSQTVFFDLDGIPPVAPQGEGSQGAPQIVEGD